MGGKTQQRLAGNAKPTSSGRIRELMINKQQGLSNIITFSTLANNSKSNQKEAPKDKTMDQHQQEPNDDRPKEIKEQNDKQTVDNTTSPTKTIIQEHKPKLIVKRIGNRDYFTRVKVPLESLQQAPSLPPSSSTLHSRENLNDESKKDPVKLSSEATNFESNSNDEKSDDLEGDEKSKDRDCDPVYDFDTILDELNEIYNTCKTERNNATSLDDLSDNHINQECKLIRVLKILVRDFREDLSIEEWDLVVKSIYKWSTIITQTEQLLTKQWKEIKDIEDKYPMMHLLLNDWENFHSSKVYQDLILLYFKLISQLPSSASSNSEDLIVVEALANIIIDVDPKSMLSNGDLKKYSKVDTADFDSDFKLPKNHKYCDIDTDFKFNGFIPICNLLKSNHRVVIVTAHGMLSNVMSILSDSVSVRINENEDDLDNMSLLPPQALMSILTSRDSMMCALLSDYKVGDISVTIEPDTDSYTCTLSYLFVWDLIIHFIVGLSKENGHKVIHSLKKLGLIQNLLDNVFMLLPPLDERDSLRFGPKPESYDKKSLSSENNPKEQLATISKIYSLDDFLKSSLKTTIPRPKNEIELTALHVYFSIALHMPVTVRKWYNNNSNKKLSNLVNEYTVKHISQIICTLEMETVQEKCQERANEDKSNNLIIKARPNAREVYAVYTRDEFRMELTIKLPINYPLGSVQIDGGKRVGVTDLKWRSWLLQLTTFLSHQNGPILDGIDLWRKNIDKRFEGIEKCMICFSILHSNYQLPKKKCITCTKMFHNSCLYKWFETSGNSTCPLCRNIW